MIHRRICSSKIRFLYRCLSTISCSCLEVLLRIQWVKRWALLQTYGSRFFGKVFELHPTHWKLEIIFLFLSYYFFFVSIFISIDFLIVTAQKEHESIVFLDDKCSFYYTCLEMLVLLQWCYVAKYFHERDFLFFFFLSFWVLYEEETVGTKSRKRSLTYCERNTI